MSTMFNCSSITSRSLISLVRLFQYLGLSFGGLDPFAIGSPDRYNRWIILWSMVVFLFQIFAYFMFMYYGEKTVYTRFIRDLIYTKPIIRYLIIGVSHLFGLNIILNYAQFSFGQGRTLIQHLNNLRPLHDPSREREIWHLICTQVVSFLTMFIMLDIWFHISSEQFVFENRLLDIAFLLVNHLIHFALVSSVIFQVCILVYVVQTYAGHLSELHTRSQGPYHLTHLIQIRNRVTQLQCHFNRTVRLLQVVLVSGCLSSCWVLVGTCCLMLLMAHLDNFPFVSYLYLILSESCVLLFAMIYYGNRVHREYCILLEAITDRVVRWNSLKLLYLQRLSANSSYFGQFRIRLFGTFQMNQTLLVSLSTFILNYIVVLVQTEQPEN